MSLLAPCSLAANNVSIDATTWTIEHVLSWGKEIGLNEKNLNKLQMQEVMGITLLSLTYGNDFGSTTMQHIKCLLSINANIVLL